MQIAWSVSVASLLILPPPPTESPPRDGWEVGSPRSAGFEPAALETIVQRTQGYPFFLQEWASAAWNIAEGPEITREHADHAYTETLAKFDTGFFKVRLDRLTKAETQFVRAMAQLGNGPYAMTDIAQAMDRTQQSIGPARGSIIAKGVIYCTSYGYVDFSVPLFAEFLRRVG